MKKEIPLVSICVISYNSAETIIETLNSIKGQTYNPLELIISDDCSEDNTIDVVQRWIEENNIRFVRTKIITSRTNTGVTANCNRAYREAKGVFVKDIADDILKSDYVETCVEFFYKTPDCFALFTGMDYFYAGKVFKYTQPAICNDFFKLSSEEQYKWIIKNNIPEYPTPSVIYRKSLFEKVGYFDERIPMWEDGPFYHKLAENNIKVFKIDKILVSYRLVDKSLSNGLPLSLRKSLALFYKYYRYPIDKKRNIFLALFRYVKYFLGYHFLYALIVKFKGTDK